MVNPNPLLINLIPCPSPKYKEKLVSCCLCSEKKVRKKQVFRGPIVIRIVGEKGQTDGLNYFVIVCGGLINSRRFNFKVSAPGILKSSERSWSLRA